MKKLRKDRERYRKAPMGSMEGSPQEGGRLPPCWPVRTGIIRQNRYFPAADAGEEEAGGDEAGEEAAVEDDAGEEAAGAAARLRWI